MAETLSVLVRVVRDADRLLDLTVKAGSDQDVAGRAALDAEGYCRLGTLTDALESAVFSPLVADYAARLWQAAPEDRATMAVTLRKAGFLLIQQAVAFAEETVQALDDMGGVPVAGRL